MDGFTKYLNFLGWPAVSGILVAIVFLQYQQLQQLTEQGSATPSSLDAAETAVRTTEALLAQIAVSKHSEHMPLNRQAVDMARHGVPIDRPVLADWMDRTGALIAPVVDRNRPIATACLRGA